MVQAKTEIQFDLEQRTAKSRQRDCQLLAMIIEHYFHSFKFIYEFNNIMESIPITGSLAFAHSFHSSNKLFVWLSHLAPATSHLDTEFKNRKCTNV